MAASPGSARCAAGSTVGIQRDWTDLLPLIGAKQEVHERCDEDHICGYFNLGEHSYRCQEQPHMPINKLVGMISFKSTHQLLIGQHALP